MYGKNQLQNHRTIAVFLKFTIIGIDWECFIQKPSAKTTGPLLIVFTSDWQLTVACTDIVAVHRVGFPRIRNSCLVRSKEPIAVRYAVGANDIGEPWLRCRSGSFRFVLNRNDTSNVAILVMVCMHFICVLNRNPRKLTIFFIIGQFNCQHSKWPISVSYICEPCAATDVNLAIVTVCREIKNATLFFCLLHDVPCTIVHKLDMSCMVSFHLIINVFCNSCYPRACYFRLPLDHFS